MGADEPPRGAPPAYFRGLPAYGDPRPAHEVVVEPFCIDRYEVTVERYEQCVLAGACDPGEKQSRPLLATSYQTRVNHYPAFCGTRGERCPTHAVNCRSFDQADAYCRWIGRRLCTEAEWERAASGPGPARRRYPWGSAPDDGSRANTSGHGPGHVVTVDSYPDGVSAEGVFNLAGNVYEWVSEPYGEYAPMADSQPAAATAGAAPVLRIGRGGCFLSRGGYSSTDRTTFAPDFDWGCVGIRCCSAVATRRSPNPGNRDAVHSYAGS